MIPNDKIATMQADADAGLRGETPPTPVTLAEHVNDLLDERGEHVREIVRLTGLLAERDEQLVRMAAERDTWRAAVDDILLHSRG